MRSRAGDLTRSSRYSHRSFPCWTPGECLLCRPLSSPSFRSCNHCCIFLGCHYLFCGSSSVLYPNPCISLSRIITFSQNCLSVYSYVGSANHITSPSYPRMPPSYFEVSKISVFQSKGSSGSSVWTNTPLAFLRIYFELTLSTRRFSFSQHQLAAIFLHNTYVGYPSTWSRHDTYLQIQVARIFQRNRLTCLTICTIGCILCTLTVMRPQIRSM